MDKEINTISKIIVNMFDSIKIENTSKAINIYDAWKKILKELKSTKINSNEGENLSDHSWVIDLKKGVLFVEVDHPGWIEILNTYRRYILNKMRKKFPKTEFKTLAFTVKNSNPNRT